MNDVAQEHTLPLAIRELIEEYERTLEEYWQIETTLEYQLAFLQKRMREIELTGWNIERAAKLRRLETVFAQMAATLHSEYISPEDVLVRLRAMWSMDMQHIPMAPLPLNLPPLDLIPSRHLKRTFVDVSAEQQAASLLPRVVTGLQELLSKLESSEAAGAKYAATELRSFLSMLGRTNVPVVVP